MSYVLLKKVLERLTANAKLATVLGSILHPSAQWNLREAADET